MLTLAETLRAAQYFMDQIRQGNAFSEGVLWAEVKRLERAAGMAEGLQQQLTTLRAENKLLREDNEHLRGRGNKEKANA